MGKYQYGGYCPKCVSPIDASIDGVFWGVEERCCPSCGYVHDKTEVADGVRGTMWPRAAIRRVGFLWWSRWEVLVPSEKGATDGTA